MSLTGCTLATGFLIGLEPNRLTVAWTKMPPPIFAISTWYDFPRRNWGRYPPPPDLWLRHGPLVNSGTPHHWVVSIKDRAYAFLLLVKSKYIYQNYAQKIKRQVSALEQAVCMFTTSLYGNFLEETKHIVLIFAFARGQFPPFACVRAPMLSSE